MSTSSRAVSDAERAAAANADPTGIGSLRAILRIRPFRRLWIVLGIASLGDWLGLLATSIFAAQQVQNPTAKGVAFGGVIAVRLLPALLLGPLAGVFADRFDRRHLMVVCDLVRFVLFASIPVAALVTSNGALVIGWTAIATFLVEAVTMAWLPAKDASVPNLLPKGRLETANQLTLATTYGITPVAAALLLAGLTKGLASVYAATGQSFLNPVAFSLYFLALTRLVTAYVVFFGIREISGRDTNGHHVFPGVFREFVNGWAYVGKTPLVRGLVLGILAAFAGGGLVVGIAQFYAVSLGGGESTFYVLFAMIFVGLAIGIAAGPRLIGALSRRRWFGLSIVLAGGAVGLMAFAWHLSIAMLFVLLVGIAAGMAFLSGTTLLGGEVEDEVRGRVFGFVNMATRVVLMLAISLSSVLVGLGSDRVLSVGNVSVTISTTRILLFVAGVVGVLAGIGAFRQMDDKPGVAVLADLWSSLRGRPLSVPERVARRGLFVVFEGGEGSGKSTQVELLATRLNREGRDVVVTREPGATDVGVRIRSLLLDRHPVRRDDSDAAGVVLTPRAEALLYAADRAHHVASVVRPGLAVGSVVISDRYIDSSLAYQGAGRILPVNEVSWLSAWATGGLQPDLVVLLDVDPAIGLARIADRGDVDRLEGETVAFHERVRYAFLDLASADPRRYLVIDATEPAETIAEIVSERVQAMLPPHTTDDAGGSSGWLTGPVPTEEVPDPPPVAEVDPGDGLEPPVQSSNGHGRIGRAALAGKPTLSHVDGQI
ncbi:MAG: dTMP kinase [Micromonosporaceae bacterium]|nr:dTMP kinase [Micromonosporaceae bacterium]